LLTVQFHFENIAFAMTEIEAISGVPMPEQLAKRPNYQKRLSDENKKVILAMKPGESFVALPEQAQAAYTFARRNGIRLAKTMLPNGNCRVWRRDGAL
jgi:hypothetical protein